MSMRFVMKNIYHRNVRVLLDVKSQGNHRYEIYHMLNHINTLHY
jgi:hypothetical protein